MGKLKSQIAKLENQIRHGDAELLALQKENVALQDRLSNNVVPVVPITSKENSEGLPDTNSRKKLLGKSTVTHHS